MNRKTIIFLMLGVASAGLICLIVGLILHFTPVGSSLVGSLASLSAMITGSIMIFMALAVTLIALIIFKFKNSER